MCGIAGLWNEANLAVVRAMVRSIAHRGPDGLEFAVFGNHSLGASRLAIYGDLSASAIFHDPSSGVQVLLNGEVYNVGDLREELAARGALFRTDLEAEVVARLYEAHGLAFPIRLKGMFAIAILDGNRLVLARDRFGIKPLYYCDLGEKVAFGSEIKAVLQHPGLRPRLSLAALEDVVVFGYLCSPTDTLFQGIRQVEPGSVLVFDGTGRHQQRYGAAPAARYLATGESIDRESVVTQLREHLIDAVAAEFSHGEHEKGLYLSGGLDSSTVAVVAKAILGYPISTFTLTDSADSDDFRAAREVAARLGTLHVERTVGVSDYFASLDDFIYHYEAIVAGGVFDLHGGVAFHLLTEAVAEHVRVAFSGEGADELFGGYYWAYTHPLGFSDRIRGRLKRLPTAQRVTQYVEELFPQPEDELVYRRHLLDALLSGGLSNYHLQSVDRSCGAFGFEIRPVYLYDDLANFALSLPIEFKVPDKKTTKRILREAFRPEFERLGLGWVLSRLKQGMPAAVEHLAQAIRKRMEAAVSDDHFVRHPLRSYLVTKSDVYLFDKFTEQFRMEIPDVPQSGAAQ